MAKSTKSADPKAARKAALDQALSQIEKSFGSGSMMRLGDRPKVAAAGISTGLLSLDLALGGAGVPRGRVVEIYGPESSGKTTFCSHIIANAQKAGGLAAFIDAEHAFDPSYARRLGVDVENLYISQPDCGEQALEIAEILIRSGTMDVIVIDSVAALVPRAELQGEMGDSHVGLQARLMSQALRKLTAAINHSQTTVIFTNQIREKIGVMFGSPETTTGGRALKFYSSVRMDIRRLQQIKEGEETVGHGVRIKVVKNKMAPPFKQVEFQLLFNEGFSRTTDLIELGAKLKVVKRAGSWLSYGEEKLGQGMQNSKRFLEDNPKIMQSIEREIREALGMVAPESETEASNNGQKHGG